MQLTEDQKKEVTRWIAEGAKLSEVQRRLEDEFAIRLTYMEARLLVDDLKLVPKDPVQPAPKVEAPLPPVETPAAPSATPAAPLPPMAPPQASGNVRVQLDEIVRPGALVSGTVMFSDGEVATWQLDQTGRFGLVPATTGYRPSAPDFAEFRASLEKELTRLGL